MYLRRIDHYYVRYIHEYWQLAVGEVLVTTCGLSISDIILEIEVLRQLEHSLMSFVNLFGQRDIYQSLEGEVSKHVTMA